MSYNSFGNMTENRDVKQSHVNKLVESIKNKDMLRYNPILVNDSMDIIDGQHRLEAARKLKKPIYYITARDLNSNDMQTLNNVSKHWSLSDYVESYVIKGNKDYIYLKDFSKSYGLTLTISMYLLGDNSGRACSNVKTGNFKAKNKASAVEIASFISGLNSTFSHYKQRTFIYSMISVWKKTFCKDRLKSVLDRGVKKCATKSDYVTEIQINYNKGLMPKNRVLFVDL